MVFKCVQSLTFSRRQTSCCRAYLEEGKTKSRAGIFLTVAAAFGLLRNLPSLPWLTVFTVVHCVTSPPCPSMWKMGCLTLGCISIYFQSIHVLERTASSSTEPSVSRQLLEPEPVPLSKVSGGMWCFLRRLDACCGPAGS